MAGSKAKGQGGPQSALRVAGKTVALLELRAAQMVAARAQGPGVGPGGARAQGVAPWQAPGVARAQGAGAGQGPGAARAQGAAPAKLPGAASAKAQGPGGARASG